MQAANNIVSFVRPNYRALEESFFYYGRNLDLILAHPDCSLSLFLSHCFFDLQSAMKNPTYSCRLQNKDFLVEASECHDWFKLPDTIDLAGLNPDSIAVQFLVNTASRKVGTKFLF